MLAIAALYFTFNAADGAFLSEHQASGPVVNKLYLPAHEEYRTQNVGGVNRNLKIMVPNAWLLEIDLGGPRVRASVDPDVYESMQPGTMVRIQYRKRRISGTLQVTQYLGKEGG